MVGMPCTPRREGTREETTGVRAGRGIFWGEGGNVEEEGARRGNAIPQKHPSPRGSD